MPEPLPFLRPGQSSAGPVFQKIAIVGLGLIGGSVALAVRRAWPDSLVIGVDKNAVLEEAMRVHAIDVGADDLGMVSDADLTVLAAPVLENARILRDRVPALVSRPAVITDVGSVKRVMEEAAAALPAHLRFVGGHPMAGAAQAGLAHARADLFARHPWILCAPPGGDLCRVDEFVRTLGADPQPMDAATHDRLVAFVSHLPQLAASVLMAVAGEAAGEAGLASAGNGLRDTTRLASSPVEPWCDIAAANADEIARALDAAIAALREIRDDLAGGDALARWFSLAQHWRSRLPQ